jgi:hypothetical protein
MAPFYLYLPLVLSLSPLDVLIKDMIELLPEKWNRNTMKGK